MSDPRGLREEPSTPRRVSGAADELLVVDGFNVLGSRPDGWWKDRPAAMRRLVERLNDLGAREGTAILVVFDGKRHETVAAAAGDLVEVGFAPGGPNAADKVIAARVREHERPERTLVVSSDRRLQASVKAAGGRRIGAGEFLSILGGHDRE